MANRSNGPRDPVDSRPLGYRIPEHPRAELALDVPPPLRLSNVAIRRDDKMVFDEYQAYCTAEAGRRFTQWDAFTHLLADALENPRGRFARWRRR